MNGAPLGQRQLFGMKKENLMKRIAQQYDASKNAAEAVEYLMVMLIRHALCVGDYYPEALRDLIRQLFLTATPNDTLRRYCVFFEEFLEEHWQTVRDRLFKHDEEFLAFTKEARRFKALLEKKRREMPVVPGYQFIMVSIFKDAQGKKHTWKLRDTKKVLSEDETSDVLTLLTTLTVFQAGGVRRFAEYVSFKSHKTCLDSQHKAVIEESVETPSERAAGNESSQAVQATTSEPESKKEAPKAANVPPAEESCPVVPTAPLPKTTSRTKTAGKIDPFALLGKPDTSYMRHGKSNEQIQAGREQRKRRKKLKKIVNRKK